MNFHGSRPHGIEFVQKCAFHVISFHRCSCFAMLFFRCFLLSAEAKMSNVTKKHVKPPTKGSKPKDHDEEEGPQSTSPPDDAEMVQQETAQIEQEKSSNP